MIPVIIAESLQGEEARLIAKHLPATSYAIIADENTYEVLGKRILTEISPKATKLVLDKNIKPDEKTVAKTIEFAKKHECKAIIAVGSGTINDICKYASHKTALPYVVFATAPSMNGYNSANASIINGSGHKSSRQATAAQAVFCDLQILANAPKRLILSGLGDSICRPTAQSDWLFSHLFSASDYSAEPFEWLTKCENQLFNNADKLLNKNTSIIKSLMQTLITSGEGMRFVKSSSPASGGEHMIAHTMEMMNIGKANLAQNYHGEEIGVTTITCSEIQHDILQSEKFPISKAKSFPTKLMQKYFSAENIQNFADIYDKKQRIINRSITNMSTDKWQNIKQQIVKTTMPTNEIINILESSTAKTKAKDLTWEKQQYQDAITLAPFTRDRITFLDLYE